LNSLPNHIIAQLNNHAYKSISKGNLNTLLNKRALANASIYKELDNQITDLVNNQIDFIKVSQ